jgi:uncharacterized protein YeaO (DUF488 family)
MPFRIKRVYDPISPRDGLRVLVDRLWPRGVSKAEGRLDLWLREVAPSDALRKRFTHDPSQWRSFRAAYFKELRANPEAVQRLKREGRRRTVTLLYAARDTRYNNAVALLEFLTRSR